jgi:hypothetical protein
MVNRGAAPKWPYEVQDGVSQYPVIKRAAQAAGEKAGISIWFERGDLGCFGGRCALVGASAMGFLIVVMDTTVKKGQLTVGPAQRMDQQSFAGIKCDESID